MQGCRVQNKSEFPRLEMQGIPAPSHPNNTGSLLQKWVHWDAGALRKGTKTVCDNSRQPCPSVGKDVVAMLSLTKSRVPPAVARAAEQRRKGQRCVKRSCGLWNRQQWKTGVWKPVQSNRAVRRHRAFEGSHSGRNPAPLHKNTRESKCHPALSKSLENQRRERTDASVSSPGCDGAAGNKQSPIRTC